MTGYGKAICYLNEKTVMVEVRSLNSKSLDINLKIPQLYKEKEQFLRTSISQTLERGKVELSISIEHTAPQASQTLNKPLISMYYKELEQVALELGVPVSDQLLAAVLRLPEVLKQEVRQLDQQEWETIASTVQQALEQNDAFRLSEGRHLQEDLTGRCRLISNLLQQISPLEQARITTLKNRIKKSLAELKESLPADDNRFEQELIYYLEKLDISEEKVRLTKHLEYFQETLDESTSQGKKLGFISQEMGREINTIGSKANDASIQKLVVQMKDELEKIKEQLMNVL